MKCTNCGQEFTGNFCPNCGTPAPKKEFCPQCGNERPAGARFCARCGHRFAAAAAPAAQTPQAASGAPERTAESRQTAQPQPAGQEQTARQPYIQQPAVSQPAAAQAEPPRPMTRQTGPQQPAVLPPEPQQPAVQEAKNAPQAQAVEIPPQTAPSPEPQQQRMQSAESAPQAAESAESAPQAAERPADGRPCKALAFLDKSAGKIYKLLYFVPACAFALMTVLLFAFFAAPVATDPFFGMSAGSGYDLLGQASGLQGALIALLVFALFGLALAVLMLVQVFKKPLRHRTVKVFGRTFYQETALNALAGLWLFVYFLLGCILCGQAAGLGLSAGAFPALVIVFSILAGICAAAPVLRFFLAKREPALAGPEREAARAYEAAQEEKNAAALAAFLAEEPSLPDPAPAKPQKPPLPQLGCVRDVNKVMRKKRRVAFFVIMYGAAMILLGSVALAYLLGDMSKDSFVVGMSVSAALWFTCLIVGMVLISCRREGKWDERKSCKNGGMTAIAVICGIFGFEMVLGGIALLAMTLAVPDLLSAAGMNDSMGLGLSIGAIIASAWFLGPFGAALAARGKNRQLAEYFYGARKPLPGAPLRFSFTILNREQLTYLDARKAYRDYRKKQRNLGYEKKCWQKKKLPAKPVLWLNGNRVWLSVVAILLVAALVLACVLPPVLGNKFRAGNVSRVELGMHDYEVEQILGEPDEQSDTQWVWYGGEYKSLADEAARLEEQLAAATDFSQIGELTERLAELEARAATLEFPVILVEFTDGEVDAVWLDMCMSTAGSAEKQLSSVRVLEGEIEAYTSSAEISYEANFADGSYVKAYAAAATEGGALAEGSRVTVTWSDRWAEYSAEIAVSENRSGYYMDGSVLHVVTNNGAGKFPSSFDKTAVTALVVEEGVTEIGQNAFDGFTALETITLPDGLTKIGNSAFTNTAYYADDANWENGALYIGQYLVDADNVSGAFTAREGTVLIADYALTSESAMTSFSAPEGLRFVGEGAFRNCSRMETLSLPASVEDISGENYIANNTYYERSAFSGCTALESITVASGNARYSDAGDNLIDTEQNILLVGSANSEIPTDGSVTRIAAGAFVYGGSYTNGMQQDGALYVSGCLVAENDSIDGMLTVREGTWLIADLVFWREMYITEASLPNSVQYIGNYAFYECGQLASVTFGSGLVSIGEGAFRGCYSLASVTIPANVTYIGADAFWYCNALSSMTFGQTSGWTVSGTTREGELTVTVPQERFSDSWGIAEMFIGDRYGGYYYFETADGYTVIENAVWTRA